MAACLSGWQWAFVSSRWWRGVASCYPSHDWRLQPELSVEYEAPRDARHQILRGTHQLTQRTAVADLLLSAQPILHQGNCCRVESAALVYGVECSGDVHWWRKAKELASPYDTGSLYVRHRHSDYCHTLTSHINCLCLMSSKWLSLGLRLFSGTMMKLMHTADSLTHMSDI